MYWGQTCIVYQVLSHIVFCWFQHRALGVGGRLSFPVANSLRMAMILIGLSFKTILYFWNTPRYCAWGLWNRRVGHLLVRPFVGLLVHSHDSSASLRSFARTLAHSRAHWIMNDAECRCWNSRQFWTIMQEDFALFRPRIARDDTPSREETFGP